MTRHYDETGDEIPRTTLLIELGPDVPPSRTLPADDPTMLVVHAACLEAERRQREQMEAGRARLAVEMVRMRAEREAVRKHVMDRISERLPS